MKILGELVYSVSSRITLPVLAFTPFLLVFTIFSLLDENFLPSDVLAVLLLWALIGVSLIYFLAMRKEPEPKAAMFGIGSAQLLVLAAACSAIFTVVEEDSNTPRTEMPTFDRSELADLQAHSVR